MLRAHQDGAIARIGQANRRIPLCPKRRANFSPRYLYSYLGKLRLFENYINFSSKFNSKTIFGYSDIRVPKWDIIAISEDRHLLSMMVVLETKHGAIGFTSFLSNPLQLMQSTYSNRRSGVSVLQHPHAESELQLL